MKKQGFNAFGFIAIALVPCLIAMARPAEAAATIRVNSVKGLERAIKNAAPGMAITLMPGKYRLKRKIKIRTAGRANARISLRARRLGEVVIESPLTEAFKTSAPYWTFENLVIRGACRRDHDCEHALHIVGNAHHTIVRNVVMRDFNAMIKAGHGGKGKKRRFPDDGLIERSAFFNSTARQAKRPVTPIDVNGADNWVVRGNFIADFAKLGRRPELSVSYGAFFKSNSHNGVFESNLVICEWRHQGGIRIGLSFGGGGTTGAETCRDRDCTTFHTNGVMRNNIIMNCPADVGIYLNRSKKTEIFNNLLINTNGIDVRYENSDALVRNNIIAGGVRGRDGGNARSSDNLMGGTPYAMVLPAAARYLIRRLDGQEAKYPALIGKQDVEKAQAWVRDAQRWVSSTWLGSGTILIDELYAEPGKLDFSLMQ
ncbi:MAG: right-handed parallel beta-helix repeat-containing protein, partial [Alphaproteobacteria bacterium]|nr:right-handed parallel beta-helix repeat-containing protein [Alphaproteobacteria bacterium]